MQREWRPLHDRLIVFKGNDEDRRAGFQQSLRMCGIVWTLCGVDGDDRTPIV